MKVLILDYWVLFCVKFKILRKDIDNLCYDKVY